MSLLGFVARGSETADRASLGACVCFTSVGDVSDHCHSIWRVVPLSKKFPHWWFWYLRTAKERHCLRHDGSGKHMAPSSPFIHCHPLSATFPDSLTQGKGSALPVLVVVVPVRGCRVRIMVHRERAVPEATVRRGLGLLVDAAHRAGWLSAGLLNMVTPPGPRHAPDRPYDPIGLALCEERVVLENLELGGVVRHPQVVRPGLRGPKTQADGATVSGRAAVADVPMGVWFQDANVGQRVGGVSRCCGEWESKASHHAAAGAELLARGDEVPAPSHFSRY